MPCRLGVGRLVLGCMLLTQPLFSQLGSGGHAVSGYVRENGTNSSLQGVALQLFASGQRAAPDVSSGLDGEFHFGGVRDGDYSVVAKKQGYSDATVNVSVTPSGVPPVIVTLTKLRAGTESSTGAAVSARELSIPQKAQQSFEKGRELLYEKSSPEKAIREFEHAVAEYPDYYEAYTQIGVAQYRLKKPADAEASLRKAIELSANKYPDALYLLAELLNDQKRFPEAEPVAHRAAQLDDSSWHAHLERARALVGLKQGAGAEQSASRAHELKPDNAEILLVLANAHILEGNYPAVVGDFDDYLKLAPKGPQSEMIRERRDRLQKALQAAQNGAQPPHRP